ncbi:MAG: hypothetical protein KJZ93_14725 [Caldilineaceae bacterium]|nr:hypothetical protein [Caldilineaceae bacterium]
MTRIVMCTLAAILLTGCKAPVAPLVAPLALWLGVAYSPTGGPPPPVVAVEIAPIPVTPAVDERSISAADCPEAPQLPLLCTGDRALVEYAAGVRQEPPFMLTAPVAFCQLPSQQAGDSICAATFGADWVMANTETPGNSAAWADFSPAGTGFWVWDEQSDELAADE